MEDTLALGSEATECLRVCGSAPGTVAESGEGFWELFVLEMVRERRFTLREGAGGLVSRMLPMVVPESCVGLASAGSVSLDPVSITTDDLIAFEEMLSGAGGARFRAGVAGVVGVIVVAI